MESVTKVTTTEGSQSSVTSGAPKTGVVPHSTGENTGAQVSSGGVLSVTSMVCTQVDVFPH